MHPALLETNHRPWSVPSGPWIFKMNWHDLLFAHWPIDADLLAKFMPEGLEIETYDDTAWLGIVPFFMTAVAPRFFPSFPPVSNFLELNVRTYVRHAGKSSVWFFSLDAASKLAVRAARTFFRLPYFDARMSLTEERGSCLYSSKRFHKGSPPAEFVAKYRPTSEVKLSIKGTLESWLTERYCLYSADKKGRLFCCDIHHKQWPLQNAEAEIFSNTMSQQLGLTLPQSKPLLHFSKFLEVIAWPLKKV